MKGKYGVILTGGVIGFLAVLLVWLGNPGNMGMCIACFLRDTAGALGLHKAEVVQYIRPEVSGIILGAFLMAVFSKEFRPKGGSSAFTRFIIGFFVVIGALVFLGCPLRVVLRLAGGDLNAIWGLAGFAGGILVGVVMLNKGFSLGRTYKSSVIEGGAISLIAIGLVGLLVITPSLVLFSAKGPGSMHAPWFIALGAGLIVGAMAQRSRLCMVGGIRDLLMFKDWHLMSGFVAIFVVALIGNIYIGKFHLGFTEQPIAHTDALWNFSGMVLAGWGSVLLGGCPLRQLIMSGEGSSDSAMTIMGVVIGAAFAHNFKLASSPDGPTMNGKIAVIIGLIVLVIISFYNINKQIEFKNVKEGR
ncbi:MAG: YedE family putative selenium transporter [Filifactoraceae bacterium]